MPTQDNIKPLNQIDISDIVYNEISNNSSFALLEEDSFRKNLGNLKLNLSRIYDNDTKNYTIIKNKIGVNYLLLSKVISKKVKITQKDIPLVNVKNIAVNIELEGKIIDIRDNSLLCRQKETAFVENTVYLFSKMTQEELLKKENNYCKQAAEIAAVNLSRNILKKF